MITGFPERTKDLCLSVNNLRSSRMKNKKYVTGLVIAVAGLVLALAPTAQADITLQDGHTGPYRIAFNTTGHWRYHRQSPNTTRLSKQRPRGHRGTPLT